MGLNNEDRIGKMVKSACKPVYPSPGLRDRLRRQLTHEMADDDPRGHSHG
ncbi:MAG: hypothetical protein R6T78_04160 [Dehalococcoidales bacterium]